MNEIYKDIVGYEGKYQVSNLGNVKSLNYHRSGKKSAENHKKTVYQYDLQGNFIKEWRSATDIHKELGFSNSNIAKCCRNKSKTAYGYIWRYKEVVE